MKKVAFLILFYFTLHPVFAFAQTEIPSQIERTQQILQKEEALKEKINKPEKKLVKTIQVSGVTLVSIDKIQSIILPFQNRWLTEPEVESILASIKMLYEKTGFPNQPAEVSYKIEKHNLNIQVLELSQIKNEK